MEFSASPHIWTWSCFVCFCSLYEGRPQLVGCQSTNHFLHETLHFSAFVFCKRWGSLWLAVSDFYYLSLVLTNHNYLSKILSRSSITLVPVEISFEVSKFRSLQIFASTIVLSLWRTLLFFFHYRVLCYFSLDQWEIKMHLLWGKCFNIPHWPRSHSTHGKLQHIEEISKSKTRIGMVWLKWLILGSIDGFLIILFSPRAKQVR